jgi:hypothetical protein
VKGIIEGVLSTIALVIFFAILPMVNMAEEYIYIKNKILLIYKAFKYFSLFL